MFFTANIRFTQDRFESAEEFRQFIVEQMIAEAEDKSRYLQMDEDPHLPATFEQTVKMREEGRSETQAYHWLLDRYADLRFFGGLFAGGKRLSPDTSLSAVNPAVVVFEPVHLAGSQYVSVVWMEKEAERNRLTEYDGELFKQILHKQAISVEFT